MGFHSSKSIPLSVDQMMVMMRLALMPLSQLIPCPAISEIKPSKKPHIHQDIKRSVNSRQSYRRLFFMDLVINILRTQVVLSRA